MKHSLVIYFLLLSVPIFAQIRLEATGATAHDSLPPAIGHKSYLGSPHTLPAPQQTSVQEINWTKFGIASGLMAGSFVGLYFIEKSWWPDSDRTAFHIQDDPDYEKNYDKFGHGFGAYYTSHFFQEAFAWSGIDSSQSYLLGAVCGAMYEFYVEIEDGFGKSWGFSPGDAKADLIGASFFLLRNRVDFFRNFQYKWLYYPNADSLYFASHSTYNPIDDYEGQSYWFTADIHRMLPESWKDYWPMWLNLAFGIGGIGLETFDTNSPTGNPYDNRHKAYYLSLDFDMEKIIPESDIGIINFIRRGLSYWHLPAPAYRISPDPRFFVLFPFHMTIGSHAH
ncbi:MAG: DUF2279 domain-containing protein [bacterium]